MRRRSSFLARAQGFTFVELVISLVVIGIAVIGVLMIFTTTVGRSADPMIRAQALAIAQGYLDEVISMGYADPDGADGEAARIDFDDVDDYAVLVNADPRLPDGTDIPALDAYRVTVGVGAPQVLGAVNLRRVDVTVTHPSGISVSLWSFRAEY